jgi:predicted TPR repeat methyltransferase
MTVAAATAAVAARSSGASSKALAASQPAHSAAIFQQAWQVYHKLLEVDFLEHRCLYTALQELLLGQLADGQARSLLDLGCGDAICRCGAAGAVGMVGVGVRAWAAACWATKKMSKLSSA